MQRQSQPAHRPLPRALGGPLLTPSAPDFGPAWAWVYRRAPSATWTIRDEDAYRGPFHRATARPVLVIGNLWDPATNYDNAVRTAGILGNARLLTSDSWGHMAYGTSHA